MIVESASSCLKSFVFSSIFQMLNLAFYEFSSFRKSLTDFIAFSKRPLRKAVNKLVITSIRLFISKKKKLYGFIYNRRIFFFFTKSIKTHKLSSTRFSTRICTSVNYSL